MALVDYRLCDVCGNKAFYDATLHYDHKAYPNTGLFNVGAWKVICRECAKTHTITIAPKPPASERVTEAMVERAHEAYVHASSRNRNHRDALRAALAASLEGE